MVKWSQYSNMKKITPITEETIHKIKAVDARRERTKRVNDYYDNLWCLHDTRLKLLQQDVKMYKGEYQYQKNLAKRNAFEFRMKVYLGIVVGLGVILLLSR